MKKLSDVRKSLRPVVESSRPPENPDLKNEDLNYKDDPVGSAITHLTDLTDLADDMIATFSDLDSIDVATVDALGKVYEDIAKIYQEVDIEHGIIPAEDSWARESDQLTDYQLYGAKEGVLGVNEETDSISLIPKFKRLVALGLVSDEDSSSLVTAFTKISRGKSLMSSEVRLLSSAFTGLIGIITGDPSILSMIGRKLKDSPGIED